MGGVDASAGFAYQHAQAVQMALTIAAEASLDVIRVEAANDIVDVEIRSQNGHLVTGSQFKLRNRSDPWGQQELIDGLIRWSELAGDYPGSTYEFVTDGRLGPTGVKVRDALEKAASGDLNDIRQIIAGKTKGAFVSDESSVPDEGLCSRRTIGLCRPHRRGANTRQGAPAQLDQHGRSRRTRSSGSA